MNYQGAHFFLLNLREAALFTGVMFKFLANVIFNTSNMEVLLQIASLMEVTPIYFVGILSTDQT